MKIKKTEAGYSVLELLIAVLVLVVISITATTLLITVLSGSGKAAGMAVVKQNGDHAVGFIERQVRNADSVVCTGTHPDTLLVITDKGQPQIVTEVEFDSGRLKYTISGTETHLTSEELAVSGFECVVSPATSDTPVVVEVDFSLSFGSGGGPSKTFTENFGTKVSLRTY